MGLYLNFSVYPKDDDIRLPCYYLDYYTGFAKVSRYIGLFERCGINLLKRKRLYKKDVERFLRELDHTDTSNYDPEEIESLKRVMKYVADNGGYIDIT